MSLQGMVAKRQGHRTLGSYMGWLDIPSHEVVNGNLVSVAQRGIARVLQGKNVSVSTTGEEEIEVGVVCIYIVAYNTYRILYF